MRNITQQNQNSEFTSFFGEILTNTFGLSSQETQKQLSQIEKNAADLVDRNDPEVNRRLELFMDSSEEEFKEVMTEVLTSLKGLSEEDQIKQINEFFKYFGFQLQKTANGNINLNLVDIVDI